MKKRNILVVLFAIVIIVIMLLALTNIINEQVGMCVGLFLASIFSLIVSRIAYKNDIKLIAVVMILFMILGIVLFGLNVYSVLTLEDEDRTYDFQVVVQENDSGREELFETSSNKFYTYNLGKVEIVFKDKTYSLKDAFEVERITLDKILELAIPDKDTDGYKIYYDGGQDIINNSKYSIITCDGTNKVIFAPYNYKYDQKICDFSDVN